jgi:hypothetical protein
MATHRSFRLRLDLTPEAAVSAILGDERVELDLGRHAQEAAPIQARVEGRWLELRHVHSRGLTPVLCLELGELEDGGTQLQARWVHEPWELAMRACFLLYACCCVFALPAMLTAPAATAFALGFLLVFAFGTFRQPKLDGDGRAHAEAISICLYELLTPYRRDLPPGAADPFRRALPHG